MTNTRFDHDSLRPGPIIDAAIRCEVLDTNTNQIEFRVKPLSINVLDRNDNLPEIQEEEISIRLDDPHFTKVRKCFFFFNFSLYFTKVIVWNVYIDMILKLHE